MVSIWAGGNGYLDDVPIEDVSRFESEFLEYLRRQHAGILQTIRETLDLSEDTITALKDAIEEFRKVSRPAPASCSAAKTSRPSALEDEGQEKIARDRREQPTPARDNTEKK